MQRLGGTSPLGKEPPIHLFGGETQTDLELASDPQPRHTKSQAKLACRGVGWDDHSRRAWGRTPHG